MDRAQEFINSFLEHADPQYYDPVKAHEYYIKNRELKGRQTGAGLSTNQKQAFDYSKTEIAKAQAQEQAKVDEEQKARFAEITQAAQTKAEEIRAKFQEIFDRIAQASATRKEGILADRDSKFKEINGKLKDNLKAVALKQTKALKELSDRRAAELLKLSNDARAEIAALPPIPKGLSPEDTARLSDERSAKLDKIRGDFNQKSQDTSDKYGAERDTIRETAQTEKEKARDDAANERDSVNESVSKALNSVSTETKNQQKLQVGASNSERATAAAEIQAKVADAQTKYEALRQDLVAKYEGVTQAEYNAIKQTVKSNPAPSKSRSKSRSKKIERKPSK